MSRPEPVSASPPSCRNPTSALGVSDKSAPDREAARGLQRRPHAGHRGGQASRVAVDALDGRGRPQRVRLEREPETAPGPGVDQLAPRARRGHRNRQIALSQRRSGARRQLQAQPAGLVRLRPSTTTACRRTGGPPGPPQTPRAPRHP